MKWKDNTGALPGASINFGRFRLTVHHVHRYVGCSNLWFTSCYGFFDMYTLESETLHDAKKEAVGKFRDILNDASQELAKLEAG